MEPDPSSPHNLTNFLMSNIPRMKMHHMVYHIHVCLLDMTCVSEPKENISSIFLKHSK